MPHLYMNHPLLGDLMHVLLTACTAMLTACTAERASVLPNVCTPERLYVLLLNTIQLQSLEHACLMSGG